MIANDTCLQMLITNAVLQWTIRQLIEILIRVYVLTYNSVIKACRIVSGLDLAETVGDKSVAL